MTRPIFTLICLLAATLAGAAVTPDDDNITITRRTDTYRVCADPGRLLTVRNTTTATYLATRADATAAAYTFYNDGITVDKASAPGAKPVYRQWIPDDYLYTDSRICMLPIPLRRGKEAKATFERTFSAIEQFCTILIPTHYAVGTSETTVIIPSAASYITVEPRNFPDGTTLAIDTLPDGAVSYRATFHNLAPLDHQPGAPDPLFDTPLLNIKGMFDGIGSLYSYFKQYLEQDDPDDSVINLARTVVEGHASERARAEAIASWVQNNIRYIAVEHGEYGIRPDAAHEVLRKRYGDCKGSANLIRAMLRAVGLDGRMAWVGTALSVPFDWADTPTLAAGNHAIAAAILPDTILYLDGTARFAPTGYCPASIRRRPVLIEAGDSCIYARIPDTPDADRTHLRADYTLDSTAVTGPLSIEMHGSARIALLASVADTRPAMRDELLGRIALAGRKNATATSAAVAQSDSAATLSATINAPGMITRAGTATYIGLNPLPALPSVIPLKDRRRPLGLSHPNLRTVDISLRLPEGATPTLPDDATFDSPWFTGSLTYCFDPASSTVTCTGSLRSTGLGCPLDDLPAYNDAVTRISRAASARIVIK